MEKNRHVSFRLIAGTLLMFGGLVAIAAGLIIGLAPAGPPACTPGMDCRALVGAPSIADGWRRSLTN